MEQELIRQNRIGEVNTNTFGSLMEIIDYKDANNITVKSDNGYILKEVQYGNFKRGKMRTPYDRSLFGHGYIGLGKYKTYDSNYHKTPEYQTWVNMLMRVYYTPYQEKQPTYIGCTICDEWLCFQTFADWYSENYYEVDGERMQLDKDILFKGNKIYSPETCIFVPQRINSLFTKCNASRGDLPVGVSSNKDNKFVATSGLGTKVKHIGLYNTSEDAFMAYKEFKEQLIKDIADNLKDEIPKKLYDAMHNYIVEITD